MKITTSLILDSFSQVSFTENEKKLIVEKFKTVYLKKGEIVIKPNCIVKHQYYVYSGCLRAFHIDKSAKEHTMQFATKDWWISDFTALFTSSKSIMTIEVLQDAVLFKVSKKDIEELYSKIPKLESLFRKKLEKAYASFQKRILANLSKTAQERYSSFVKNYPDFEKNIKNYHIASFLGITSESLSRIRKTLKE